MGAKVLADLDLESMLYDPQKLWEDERIRPNAVDLTVSEVLEKKGRKWALYEPAGKKYQLKRNTPYKVIFAERAKLTDGSHYYICERSTSSRLGMYIKERRPQTLLDEECIRFEAIVESLFFDIQMTKDQSSISQLVVTKGGTGDMKKDRIKKDHGSHISMLSDNGNELEAGNYIQSNDIISYVKPTYVLESVPKSFRLIDIDRKKAYRTEDYWKRLTFENNRIRMKKGRMYLFDTYPVFDMFGCCGFVKNYSKNSSHSYMPLTLVDIGFRGSLSAPIWSLDDQEIYASHPMSQMSILELSRKPSRLYGSGSIKSNYQNNSYPNPGKMFY